MQEAEELIHSFLKIRIEHELEIEERRAKAEKEEEERIKSIREETDDG